MLQSGVDWLPSAGQKEMSEVQSAKVSKVSERAGNPVFSPSRLLAAICKVAPQFKVSALCSCGVVRKFNVTPALEHTFLK